MEVLNCLPEKIKREINLFSQKDSITEIHIRSGCCLQVNLKGENIYFDNCQISQEEIEKILFNLCDNSINVFENEISKGYITLEGGYRVGISGDYFYNPACGKYLLKQIKSLNIRIPRDKIYFINQDKLNIEKSSLIVGPPHSGKTSLIKTILLSLSKKYNIAVCDERKEIYRQDLNCDVITGVEKAAAINMATRSLNPQFIICDEIGLKKEAEEILSALNTGVKFICSAHGENFETVYRRPNIKLLIDSNVFSQIVILKQIKSNFYIEDIKDV